MAQDEEQLQAEEQKAELLRLTKELKLSEARHRSLRDSLPLAVFCKDVDGHFLHVNDLFCKWVGRGEEEILGRTDFDHFPADLAEQFRRGDRLALETGRLFHEIEQHPHATTGDPQFIEVFKQAIHSEAGPVGVYGVFWDVTDRVKAQRDLRESEDRFRSFMDQSPLVAWIKDEDFRHRYVNSTFAEMFQKSSEEILGRTDHELFDQDTADQTRANDERVLREEQTLDAVERVPDAEGKTRSWLVQKVPLKRADGRHWTGGTAIDITTRLEAVAEARLSAFGVEHANAAFFLIASDATILRVNQFTCDMLGHPREELVGMTVYDINPDLKDGEWEPHWEELRAKKHLWFEARMISRQRRIFPVEVEINFLEFEGKEFNFAFVRDISNRKEAEERLRASEERFRLVAKATQDGIWEVDAQNDSIWWNETYDRVFGPRPMETATSKEWWLDRIDAEERDDVRRSFTASLADPGADSWEADYHFTTDAGIRKFVHDRAVIVRDGDGAAVRVVGSMRDQTALESEMLERERIEKKILETQKLESLGVLAGGIAHDFNNLLTAILGNAGLVMADLPPASEHLAALKEVEKSAFRAADLCAQMLAYAGKGRIVLKRIDLNTTIRDMTRLLESSISKTANLQLRLADELCPVLVDPTQIGQVVMNLIVNASEAIGDRTGVISLSTGRVTAERKHLDLVFQGADLPAGPYVFLEVSDTGCGMSSDTKARIFEPFFTTKFTGRGLGLAAVQGIVKGHKGGMKVESKVGEGTTFMIMLPAADGDSSPQSAGLVLVVDDEANVRRTARRILNRDGFEVIEAEDGTEAMDLFRERKDELAVVLLDLSMPRMDGFAAFGEMHREAPDVPVLLMSGYNEEECMERFEGQGLAGFVHKPFPHSKLIEMAREVARTKGCSGITLKADQTVSIVFSMDSRRGDACYAVDGGRRAAHRRMKFKDQSLLRPAATGF